MMVVGKYLGIWESTTPPIMIHLNICSVKNPKPEAVFCSLVIQTNCLNSYGSGGTSFGFASTSSPYVSIPMVWSDFSDSVKDPYATQAQSMEWRVKEMIARLEAIALEKVGLGLKEGRLERTRGLGGEKTKDSRGHTID